MFIVSFLLKQPITHLTYLLNICNFSSYFPLNLRAKYNETNKYLI